jgi:hypothetical protein
MPYKVFTLEEATSSGIQSYLMDQAMITCTSGTRPASPVAGMHIWQTDTTTGLVYTGSSWEQLDANIPFAYKTVTEFVSGSTTLQNDDDLFLSVAANSTYLLDGLLITGADAGGGSGPKIGWAGPSGSSLSWSLRAPLSGLGFPADCAVNFQLADITTVSPISIDTTSVHLASAVDVYGVLITAGSAGTLQLRWAQNASVGTPVTNMYPRSWLRLRRIA